jgi:hypothetical protein
LRCGWLLNLSIINGLRGIDCRFLRLDGRTRRVDCSIDGTECTTATSAEKAFTDGLTDADLC